MEIIVTEILKTCSKCGARKLIDDFHNKRGGKGGKCSYCKNCQNKINTKYREGHRIEIYKYLFSHKEEQAIKRKTKERKMRKEAVYMLGGKCACCGETQYEFLAIDHVNNDGAKKRRNKEHPAIGLGFYKWLKENKYPKDFQILCHNCNVAKSIYGICPHKEGVPSNSELYS